jgi:two-component system C4-dicarboxylate transport sensor histidine kinase DctB
VEVRRIQVVLEAASGHARIRVRDSGAGLNDEQRVKSGTPFFTTKQQGLGMGLAISHNIMHRHRGSLTLGNADDGAGPGALAVMPLPLARGEAA